MEYLNLENVSTKINDKAILKNISCNFPKSKISVIIGRSGAGKSTLLKAISRFWDYTGSILYNNQELRGIPADKLRKDLAYVGQVPVAFRGSVLDNMIFSRKYHKMDIDRKILENFIAMVGLDPSIMNQKAKSLSVGQTQRLHLARTLSNNPSTLLLDEPASALDVISKNKFEEMIVKLKSANPELTIIIVTHDLNQARNIADYLILIEEGKLLLEEEADLFFSKSLIGEVKDKDSDMLEKLINKLTGDVN
ncbi:MAG: ATP-binding cassette domain-containing protein [Candidatus Heimdallarchaeota archaeon]|nr:ATP-binding cassette domain-containing protein [Candidatus Heimdallarchaeota archaeon]